MNPFSGIMIYVLAWWMVFFCVLPLNIQNITKPTDGSMPGAPLNPDMKRKVILTTGISVFVWLIIYGLIKADLISFREIAQQMSM